MEPMCGDDRDGGNDSQERVRLAAEVFHKYGREIRAMIQFTVEDPTEAEDLFQNLFLSFVARPLPPDIRSIRRYLYRAILNDDISRREREERYRKHIQVYAIRQKYSLVEEDPQDVAMRVEEIQEIFRMAENLRPSEAKAVAREYRLDCDRGQASRDMGIKRRSFSKYLWRGLRSLRLMSLAREGHET